MCDEKVKNFISYARSSLVEGDEGSFNPQVMNCLLNDKIIVLNNQICLTFGHM